MRPSIFTTGFLKPDECKTGDIIKFIDAGKEVTSASFKYPALTQKGTPHPKAGQPKIQFNITVETSLGEKKTLSLNMTSYTELAKSWGCDTELWIDKFATITVIPLPNGKNKMISLTAEQE